MKYTVEQVDGRWLFKEGERVIASAKRLDLLAPRLAWLLRQNPPPLGVKATDGVNTGDNLA